MIRSAPFAGSPSKGLKIKLYVPIHAGKGKGEQIKKIVLINSKNRVLWGP